MQSPGPGCRRVKRLPQCCLRAAASRQLLFLFVDCHAAPSTQLGHGYILSTHRLIFDILMVGNVPTFLVINSGVAGRRRVSGGDNRRDRLPYASFVRARAPIHVTRFVRAYGSCSRRRIRFRRGTAFHIPLQKVVDARRSPCKLPLRVAAVLLSTTLRVLQTFLSVSRCRK